MVMTSRAVGFILICQWVILSGRPVCVRPWISTWGAGSPFHAFLKLLKPSAIATSRKQNHRLPLAKIQNTKETKYKRGKIQNTKEAKYCKKYKWQQYKIQANGILFTFPLLLHLAVLVLVLCCCELWIEFQKFLPQSQSIGTLMCIHHKYSMAIWILVLAVFQILKPNPRWRTFRPAVLQTWSCEHMQASHDSESESFSGYSSTPPGHALRHLDRNISFEENAFFVHSGASPSLYWWQQGMWETLEEKWN